MKLLEIAIENQFDNRFVFILRGEHVQGASHCILGFPALDKKREDWILTNHFGLQSPLSR